ncbi:MAG: hypothetical protein IJV35_00795 [Neisseriaceae bacterium]|nr:hypothetical protein [Neisseriaceae bacterium]
MKKWQVFGITAALSAALTLTACEQQNSAGSSNTANAPASNAQAKPANGVKIGFAHCCVHGEISTMDTRPKTQSVKWQTNAVQRCCLNLLTKVKIKKTPNIRLNK